MNHWLAIEDLAKAVQAGELKAKDLVDQALETIDTHQEYNAVITTIPNRSRDRAISVDQRVTNGEQIGRLAGVPFIAKDNFLTFGSETTAASNILRGFTAPYQATAIEKLEAEGAICVAKANLDAFAHGSTTENSDFFTTKNPHALDRVPGGSSGGSAAAVVLELAPFALGTDTGGSIRQPASFSGCVGYKPTYGLVSRSGVVAMASSTDVIGPLTRTVADAALVLDVLAGKDGLDSTLIDRDPEGYVAPHLNLTGKKIGIVKEYFGDGLSKEVRTAVNEAIEVLRSAGAEIREVSLPSLPVALAVYYVLCPAEVSSNLARYDGQRFGYTAPDAKDLDESYTHSRGIGFGNEAKRRIMIGTYVLSSGYYDAYYKRAQIVRTKIINEFSAAFEEVDFLLGPSAPSVAFKIGEHSSDPLQMYLSDVMTVAANLVGNPAISIPLPVHSGLPIGIQLMAPSGHDRDLLSMAAATEAILL